jgi:hypothetical protein
VGRLPRCRRRFTSRPPTAPSAGNRYADARGFADLALEDARGLARAQTLSLKGPPSPRERYQEAPRCAAALVAFDEAGAPALAATLNYLAVVHEEPEIGKAETTYAWAPRLRTPQAIVTWRQGAREPRRSGAVPRRPHRRGGAPREGARDLLRARDTARDAWCLATLARITEERGADAEAGRLLEALAAAEKGGVTRTHAEVLVGLDAARPPGRREAPRSRISAGPSPFETSASGGDLQDARGPLRDVCALRPFRGGAPSPPGVPSGSLLRSDEPRVRLERLKARYEVEKAAGA